MTVTENDIEQFGPDNHLHNPQAPAGSDGEKHLRCDHIKDDCPTMCIHRQFHSLRQCHGLCPIERGLQQCSPDDFIQSRIHTSAQPSDNKGELVYGSVTKSGEDWRMRSFDAGMGETEYRIFRDGVFFAQFDNRKDADAVMELMTTPDAGGVK